MTFIAKSTNYEALVRGAMSAEDARRIAADDAGVMPWCVTVERIER